MSEDRKETIVLNEDADYLITVDPIDGSGVIDTNFAVASIFGIWKSKSINGLKGSDMVGSLVAIYGARTTLIVYNMQNKKVEELTLIKSGNTLINCFHNLIRHQREMDCD